LTAADKLAQDQLPPLSCCCREHSQLNEVDCFHALWNAVLLQSLNAQ